MSRSYEEGSFERNKTDTYDFSFPISESYRDFSIESSADNLFLISSDLKDESYQEDDIFPQYEHSFRFKSLPYDNLEKVSYSRQRFDSIFENKDDLQFVEEQFDKFSESPKHIIYKTGDILKGSLLDGKYDFKTECVSSEASNYVQEGGSRRHSVASDLGIFSCPWPGCHRSFSRAYNLRSHYLIHSGNKPFICDFCGLSFARNHDLRRHLKIHSGEKPFICTKCLKGFSRRDALTRHLRTSIRCGSQSLIP